MTCAPCLAVHPIAMGWDGDRTYHAAGHALREYGYALCLELNLLCTSSG